MIPAGVRPELRLLLACARLRMEPGDYAALAAILDGVLDWAAVLRLADWHGLRPLLHRHLEGLERVPHPIQVTLWATAEAIARRNAALYGDLGRLVAQLEAASIPVVAYKGPTLALRAHGSLRLREFSDLDLLLPQAEVLRARDQMVQSGGYAPEYDLTREAEIACIDSQAQYHLVLRSSALGHLVELHWKSDLDYPVERFDDPAWVDALRRDGGVATLRDEDLLLALCIHGSKHLWSSLGWLVDVAELLRHPLEIDWERFSARATVMGASRRVGLGLRLAHDLLGAPLDAVARRLADRDDIVAVAPRVVAHVLSADPGTEARFTLPMDWRLHERAALRIRMVFNAVCEPSLVEWTRWPLPKALFFAYPALRFARLLAKYLRKGVEVAFGGRRLQ